MQSQKVAAGRSTPVRLYQSLSRLRESNHRIHVLGRITSLQLWNTVLGHPI